MTLSRLSLLLILAFTAAGCGRDGAPANEQVWMGVLPCADCDGIQTRLTLASGPEGRRYRLQETYLDASGGESFDQTGEWTEERTEMDGKAAALFRLDPQGPGRWFWHRSDGALEQLHSGDAAASAGVEYRLQPL